MPDNVPVAPEGLAALRRQILAERDRPEPPVPVLETLSAQILSAVRLDDGRFTIDGCSLGPDLGAACVAGASGAHSARGALVKANHDFLLARRLSLAGADAMLYGIFDGVSLSDSPGEASRLAADVFKTYPYEGYAPDFMIGSFAQANLQLRAKGRTRGKPDAFQTTATVAIHEPAQGSLTIAHVGNCRAYLIDPQSQNRGCMSGTQQSLYGVDVELVTLDHCVYAERRILLTSLLGFEDSPQPQMVQRKVSGDPILMLLSDGAYAPIAGGEGFSLIDAYHELGRTVGRLPTRPQFHSSALLDIMGNPRFGKFLINIFRGCEVDLRELAIRIIATAEQIDTTHTVPEEDDKTILAARLRS